MVGLRFRRVDAKKRRQEHDRLEQAVKFVQLFAHIVRRAVDNERIVDARERVKHALRDVGRQLRPVIVHVCGLDLSAGDWARMYGEPKRAGITVLRLGLNALDDVYAGVRRYG